MKSYFLNRFLLLLITLWGITLVSFGMLQLTPGSPIEMKLLADPEGGMGEKSQITEAARKRLMEQYHLDKPFLERYALWLKDLATLDFGRSFQDDRPVIDKIKEALPISLIFGISGILTALLLGIPLGLISAKRAGSFVDRGIAFFCIVLYSMPSYVLGLLLLTYLGARLDWFPIYGIQSDNYAELGFFGQMLDRIHHFVLPCLCYSIGGLAFITQQQRNAILEAMGQDYIRTARAKGLSESKVFLKHAFRNSLIPIMTIIGSMIPGILGSSVIIEKLFSIPGLGYLSLDALFARDYPTIMAVFTMGSFLSLAGIFLADLMYVLVDPRINFEGKSNS